MMDEDVFERMKTLLKTFSREEQIEVYRYLGRRLALEPKPTRAVAHVTRKRGPAATFQEEYVKCGNKACRCATGTGHGPYRYKYWREDGKLRKLYLGKVTRPAAPAEPAGRARGSSVASSSAPAPRP